MRNARAAERVNADRVARGGESSKIPNASLARIRKTASTRSLDRLCTILAVTGIVLLTLRRWMLVGPYPPGLDGAQWLALGRGLNGFGRSTAGAYAPLTPLLAAFAEPIAGPLCTVRLLAALSGLTISLALLLVARDLLGPVWGLAATAIVIPASALAEPVLFGGYPQQLALAAGVLAVWASCRYLAAGGRSSLWLAGMAAFAAASAHHIYFPIVVLSILAAVGFWLTDQTRTNRMRHCGKLAIALVPAVALFATIAFAFIRAGYAPPLGASARSAADAWAYGTRESPALWLLVLVIGIASLAVLGRSRGDPAWLLAASLFVPAGLLFSLSGQPRLLPPVMIGAAMAAGLGASRVASNGPLANAITILLAVAVAATLILPADRAASRFADFYRLVDESLIQAAAVIEVDGGSGTVAVRKDRRGWPIGWWFEAQLDQPIVVGSDPRWLAFPDELEHARQAELLFDGGLDAEVFHQRAISIGVRYLVVAKWDWIGWERWITTPEFPLAILYDDDRYLVLRVT